MLEKQRLDQQAHVPEANKHLRQPVVSIFDRLSYSRLSTKRNGQLKFDSSGLGRWKWSMYEWSYSHPLLSTE